VESIYLLEGKTQLTSKIKEKEEKIELKLLPIHHNNTLCY
jgi:hypothetical protein